MRLIRPRDRAETDDELRHNLPQWLLPTPCGHSRYPERPVVPGRQNSQDSQKCQNAMGAGSNQSRLRICYRRRQPIRSERPGHALSLEASTRSRCTAAPAGLMRNRGNLNVRRTPGQIDHDQVKRFEARCQCRCGCHCHYGPPTFRCTCYAQVATSPPPAAGSWHRFR